MTAKRIEVLVTDLDMVGNERYDSPLRRITQIWSLDGEMIAEIDPYFPYELSRVTGRWKLKAEHNDRVIAQAKEPNALSHPPLDLLACYYLWHRNRIWDKGDTVRTFAEAHGVSPKDLRDEIQRQAGEDADQIRDKQRRHDPV